MTQTTSPAWIPVALSEDVPPGIVIPATLPSGPIAVWRTQSGRLSANGDRCPHRGMRLSHGFVRGETLSCIYHGWRFADDGACTHIPAHPHMTPPTVIKCNPRVAAEQDGLIWVADAKPDTAPMSLGALKPLRALMIAAHTDTIRSATEAQEVDGLLKVHAGASTLYLLPSEQGAESTLVILLVPKDAAPEACISASRETEVLRQVAEAATRAGDAT